MNQMVNYRPVTADARVRSQAMYVRFCVINGAMGQVYIEVLGVSPVSTTLPVPHTHLNTAHIRSTNGQNLENFTQISSLGYKNINYKFKLCL